MLVDDAMGMENGLKTRADKFSSIKSFNYSIELGVNHFKEERKDINSIRFMMEEKCPSDTTKIIN